jgi:hypothetical protein
MSGLLKEARNYIWLVIVFFEFQASAESRRLALAATQNLDKPIIGSKISSFLWRVAVESPPLLY